VTRNWTWNWPPRKEFPPDAGTRSGLENRWASRVLPSNLSAEFQVVIGWSVCYKLSEAITKPVGRVFPVPSGGLLAMESVKLQVL